MEEIRSELSGIRLEFENDEELLDLFGLHRESLRLAKCKFRVAYTLRNPDSPFVN